LNVKINNKLKKNWLILILLLVVSDQLSKILVQYFIPIKTSVKVISDILFFTHITNDGISFGWNPFSNSIVLFFISLIACFFIVKVLFDSANETKLNQTSLCFIIGGAIGNLIDRFFTAFNLFDYTGVVDFIDVGTNEYRFYIFNFADSFITIGIIIYIYSFILLCISKNDK
tara:strand:+ start:111 stop:626 length:516 start_codon:yes stop_codon:yes gene_type:complete